MENLEVPKETGWDKAYTFTKGLFGTIPMVGSVASETFGMILSQPITKRRDQWMQNVALVLLSLENSIENFKIENLKNNDGFVSFLIEASHISFRNHQEEKLNALKNSVKNYFIHEHLEYDRKYSFLKIVEDLTPTHIDILTFISEDENYIKESIKGFSALFSRYSTFRGGIEMDKFYFRKCVRDLEVVSLIRISSDFGDLEGLGGGGYMMLESAAPSIKLLDFGKEFWEYIGE